MASTAITGRGARPWRAAPSAWPPASAWPLTSAGTLTPAGPLTSAGTLARPGSPARPGWASPSRAGSRRSGPSGTVLSGSPGCAAADGASSLLCPSPFSAGLVALLWPRWQARPGLGPLAPGSRWRQVGPAGTVPPYCTADNALNKRICQNQGLGSCCDRAEYFLRILVIVSTSERRNQNRNHLSCQCVLTMGVVLPGVWREHGQAGEPLGSGCLWGYFCAFRGRFARGAPNGGRRRD